MRALLPLALDDPTFDVTITAGPTRRRRARPPLPGPRADGPARVRSAAGPAAPAAERQPADPAGSHVAGSWRSCCAGGRSGRDEVPGSVRSAGATDADIERGRRSPRPGPAAAVIAAGVGVLALIAALGLQRWLLALVVLLLLSRRRRGPRGGRRAAGPGADRRRRPGRARDRGRAAALGGSRAVTPGPPPPITARGTRDVVALATRSRRCRTPRSSLAAGTPPHRADARPGDPPGAAEPGVCWTGSRRRIAELAITERDPRAHAELDRLNHVAGRARRHAESVLVLTERAPDRAGPRSGGPGRRAPHGAGGDRGPRAGRPRARRTRGGHRLGRRGPRPPGRRARRERRTLLAARHPRRRHRSAVARGYRLRIADRGCRHDGGAARRGERPVRDAASERGGDEADRAGRRRAPRRPARDHRDARRRGR